MINIITRTMPERVVIDGKSYRVFTDFRIWLKALLIIEKYPLDIGAALLAPLCYIDIPENSDVALKGISEFINFGDKKRGTRGKKLIDFEKDSSYIFSAFYTQYGIDLSVEKMHYYKFCALLFGLCGEHTLLKLINIRNTELSDIKDAELKKRYAALKNEFGAKRENAEPGECIFDIMKGGAYVGKKES